MMRKKFVVVLTVICLALTMGLLAACNKNDDPPEGARWTVKSENKLWGIKTMTLVFEYEGIFKVYDSLDDNAWISGKYEFAGEIGTSTLRLYEADIALPGVEKNGEKTYEQLTACIRLNLRMRAHPIQNLNLSRQRSC